MIILLGAAEAGPIFLRDGITIAVLKRIAGATNDREASSRCAAAGQTQVVRGIPAAARVVEMTRTGDRADFPPRLGQSVDLTKPEELALPSGHSSQPLSGVFPRKIQSARAE